MDTRTKILDATQAAGALRRLANGGRPVRAVVGHFDPLLPAHGRRMAELAADGALIAIVDDPPRPILAARARAELAAALGVVDYVMLAEDAARAGLLDLLPADAVFHEEADDERRTRDLIEHVRRRRQDA